MKVRFTVACERCKAPVVVGTRAVRLHGRIWHTQCADTFKARSSQFVVR